MNNLEYNKLLEYIRLLSCPVKSRVPDKFSIFDDFLIDIAEFWRVKKISDSEAACLLDIAASLDTIFDITPEEYDSLHYIYCVGFHIYGD